RIVNSDDNRCWISSRRGQTMQKPPGSSQALPGRTQRSAPVWLRVPLLIFAGLALAFPGLQVAWQTLFWSDKDEVAKVARSFFEVISGADRGPLPALLAPGASLPDEAIAF